MNTIVWGVALPLLGLATGKITGAGMAFTRGRTVYDLAAGLLGAVLTGVPLRLAGLPEYSEPLPTLLAAVTGAILATWLTRIATWPPEPILPAADDSSSASDAQLTHDLMTTSDGTRLLINARRLAKPRVKDAATRPGGRA